MHRRQRSNLRLCIFIFLAMLFAYACGNGKKDAEDIASVNNAPVSFSEFKKEISILSKRDPSFKITQETLKEQLDAMIDKKLMLQEAMKMGLSKNESFVDTIKTFWEQTLIRELIDAKTKEWGDRIFVTDDEISKTYARMQYKIIIRLAATDDKNKAEETRQRMLKGENIIRAETIGPLAYDDVRFDVLYNAFDMSDGEAKIFEHENDYIILYLVKKDKTSIQPLDDIYNQIKSLLLEQKKQDALEKWLKEIKKSAQIQINTKLLEEASRE